MPRSPRKGAAPRGRPMLDKENKRGVSADIDDIRRCLRRLEEGKVAIHEDQEAKLRTHLLGALNVLTTT